MVLQGLSDLVFLGVFAPERKVVLHKFQHHSAVTIHQMKMLRIGKSKIDIFQADELDSRLAKEKYAQI